MKKIAVVEACYECPFFVYNFNNENNCLCKKLHLKGTEENLWKVCPLPDDYEDYNELIGADGKVKAIYSLRKV